MLTGLGGSSSLPSRNNTGLSSDFDGFFRYSGHVQLLRAPRTYGAGSMAPSDCHGSVLTGGQGSVSSCEC